MKRAQAIFGNFHSVHYSATHCILHKKRKLNLCRNLRGRPIFRAHHFRTSELRQVANGVRDAREVSEMSALFGVVLHHPRPFAFLLGDQLGA